MGGNNYELYVYLNFSIGVELGRHGLSLAVGEIIASHWSATARQTWAAPASKVLTRHDLPASLGARSLE